MIEFNEIIKIFEWVNTNKGCWSVINRFRRDEGYITVGYKGKRYNAHRLIYISLNGEIPSGMVIRHTCDNPACINPEHLLMGTKQDNSSDMVLRMRQSDWKDRKGRRAKLTKDQARDIKCSSKSSYELCKLYPVTDVQIRRIKNGTRWACL